MEYTKTKWKHFSIKVHKARLLLITS